MARYFIELSYEGTNYHGWQFQPNAITVQETLEKGLSLLLHQKIAVTGAGRTDTGVHASYYVAHFDLADSTLENPEETRFRLNAMLPMDISIHSIVPVNDELHARFSATYREYLYVIHKTKPIFKRPFSFYHYGELDVRIMNQACQALLNFRDFTSFSKLHTDVKTNNCTIMLARWEERIDGYDFTIRADRFLRNMVRAIVGTMLDVGTGKLTVEQFADIIEAKDRSNAGTSADAKGLFLTDIGYVIDLPYRRQLLSS